MPVSTNVTTGDCWAMATPLNGRTWMNTSAWKVCSLDGVAGKVNDRFNGGSQSETLRQPFEDKVVTIRRMIADLAGEEKTEI
jgi:hypothetical protein